MNYEKMERIIITLENDTPYCTEKSRYAIRFNRSDEFENVVSDLSEKLKRIAKMNYLTNVILTIDIQEEFTDIPFKRYTITYDYISLDRLPIIEHRPYVSDYSIQSKTTHKTNNNLIKTVANEITTTYNDISDKKQTITNYLQSI